MAEWQNSCGPCHGLAVSMLLSLLLLWWLLLSFTSRNNVLVGWQNGRMGVGGAMANATQASHWEEARVWPGADNVPIPSCTKHRWEQPTQLKRYVCSTNFAHTNTTLTLSNLMLIGVSWSRLQKILRLAYVFSNLSFVFVFCMRILVGVTKKPNEEY